MAENHIEDIFLVAQFDGVHIWKCFRQNVAADFHMAVQHVNACELHFGLHVIGSHLSGANVMKPSVVPIHTLPFFE